MGLEKYRKSNLKIFGGVFYTGNQKRRPALVNFSEQLKPAY